MAHTHPGAARRAEVAATIADLVRASDPERIAGELTRLYRERIPVYDEVSPGSIERNTLAVLRLAVEQFAGTAPEGAATLTELARVWAEQEIPLDLVAHSIQIGARRMFTIVRERAIEGGLPAEMIDEMQDITWEWATTSAAALHSVLRERAVASATRRADFLRGLIDGTLDAPALENESKAHGLDPSHRYHVACAVWAEGPESSDLLAALRTRGSTASLPVVDTVVGPHLIALLPSRPRALRTSAPVGISGETSLGAIPAAVDQARRCLSLALRHGRSGVHDLASLGPLPLLDGARDAADLLTTRHLAPLLSSHPEVLTTVRAYLENDRRVEQTATRLHLHRNTVRNRLLRFTELSGLDVERTEDLVVTWWLLMRADPAGLIRPT